MGANALNRSNPSGGEPKKPWPQPRGSEEGHGGDECHVRTPLNIKPSDQMRENLRSNKSRELEASLHEFGKVKGLVGKFKTKEAHLDEIALGMSKLQADKTMDM